MSSSDKKQTKSFLEFTFHNSPEIVKPHSAHNSKSSGSKKNTSKPWSYSPFTLRKEGIHQFTDEQYNLQQNEVKASDVLSFDSINSKPSERTILGYNSSQEKSKQNSLLRKEGFLSYLKAIRNIQAPPFQPSTNQDINEIKEIQNNQKQNAISIEVNYETNCNVIQSCNSEISSSLKYEMKERISNHQCLFIKLPSNDQHDQGTYFGRESSNQTPISCRDTRTLESILEKSSENHQKEKLEEREGDSKDEKYSPINNNHNNMNSSQIESRRNQSNYHEEDQKKPIDSLDIESSIKNQYSIFCRFCKQEGIKQDKGQNHIINPCKCKGEDYWAHERCIEIEIRKNRAYFEQNTKQLISCFQCMTPFSLEIISSIHLKRYKSCAPCFFILALIIASLIYFIIELLIQLILNQCKIEDTLITFYIILFISVTLISFVWFITSILKIESLKIHKYSPTLLPILCNMHTKERVISYLKKTDLQNGSI